MIERINALKDKATERANYYSRIDFPNLANEFTELVNILVEMEAIVREKEELKARVQALEENTSTEEAVTAVALDEIPMEAAVQMGCILQSHGEENKRRGIE